MIPAFLIRLAASLVGDRIAKPFAVLILIGLAIAAIWAGKSIYDRNLIERHETITTAADAVAETKAHNTAADHRAADTIRIAEDERNRREAIVTAPDGLPSPAAIRLNCERLRKAGYATETIPACSGSDR